MTTEHTGYTEGLILKLSSKKYSVFSVYSVVTLFAYE